MSYTMNRRDDNEAALVRLWKQLGCIWIEQPRENGFDGLLLRNGEMWIVEIKDGRKPPSKRKLTPNEIKRMAELEAIGVAYNVVEDEEQGMALIGLLLRGAYK